MTLTVRFCDILTCPRFPRLTNICTRRTFALVGGQACTAVKAEMSFSHSFFIHVRPWLHLRSLVAQSKHWLRSKDYSIVTFCSHSYFCFFKERKSQRVVRSVYSIVLRRTCPFCIQSYLGHLWSWWTSWIIDFSVPLVSFRPDKFKHRKISQTPLRSRRYLFPQSEYLRKLKMFE
jgi:hypothetical protein